LDRAPGFRSTGRLSRDPVRAHVSGTDLVCDSAGNWMVLEDNLRIPSGTAYAIANRRLLTKPLPELERPAELGDVDQVPAMLLETLRAAAPPRAGDEPSVALLSAGWDDSAWFEHTFLAEELGIPLVQTLDLSVRDGKLFRHIGSDVHPVDVLYARMDEDMLLSSTGYDASALRPGLLEAVTSGTLTIANALGNGVADDKAVYPYVPAMIKYYLGEKPALAQVPTWICAERAQRDYVLDNIAELVVKPIDGHGGAGVVIGPEAPTDVLEARRRELQTQPERYIAQEAIALSTHPTFAGGGICPPPDIRGRGNVSAPRRPAGVRAPAARARRYGDGTRHAGWADPGGSTRISHRELILGPRQQGHLDLDWWPTRPSGAVGNGRQHVRYLRRNPLRRTVGRRGRGDPDDGCHGVPRPRRRRRRRARPARVRAQAPVDHRPVRAGRTADGRQRARADPGVQRLYLQLPG